MNSFVVTNIQQQHPLQDRHGVSRLFGFVTRRNIVSDVVQGVIVGGVLAFITFQIIAHAYVTNVNGWTTMSKCGEPGNGMLVRGACANEFPGPINAPQEAMYWTTKRDSAGRALSGDHNYIVHFPAGQLPPNHAFWSLTMGDTRNHFVANPVNRCSVSDRSGLVANGDGSVDVYIQNAAPPGHEANWLPAPPGNFLLWLRVYLPGTEIQDGNYRVPPVEETR